MGIWLGFCVIFKSCFLNINYREIMLKEKIFVVIILVGVRLECFWCLGVCYGEVLGSFNRLLLLLKEVW